MSATSAPPVATVFTAWLNTGCSGTMIFTGSGTYGFTLSGTIGSKAYGQNITFINLGTSSTVATLQPSGCLTLTNSAQLNITGMYLAGDFSPTTYLFSLTKSTLIFSQSTIKKWVGDYSIPTFAVLYSQSTFLATDTAFFYQGYPTAGSYVDGPYNTFGSVNGGLLYLPSGSSSTATLTNCQIYNRYAFTYNGCAFNGMAINVGSGKVTMDRCTVGYTGIIRNYGGSTVKGGLLYISGGK